MLIRVGYELIYDFPQPTPMILNLNIHYTRASDIVIPDFMTTDPRAPITAYRDGFGNWCNRILAPMGRIRIASTGVVRDTGEPDEICPSAAQHPVQDLPEETLVFLLGSRYCETDHCPRSHGSLFGRISPAGREFRRSAISSTIISPSTISRPPDQDGLGGVRERRGVCRDYRPSCH